jgi:hypothetical protein
MHYETLVIRDGKEIAGNSLSTEHIDMVENAVVFCLPILMPGDSLIVKVVSDLSILGSD